MPVQFVPAGPVRHEIDAAGGASRYPALAAIERGFRRRKSDPAIGPLYHRLPERMRAHALICFLALLLYRVMGQRLAHSQRPESPRHALHSLRQIQRHGFQLDGRRHSGLEWPTRQQQAILPPRADRAGPTGRLQCQFSRSLQSNINNLGAEPASK